MANVELISETPISMAELKEQLKAVKERDGELNFRANKTQEHLNMFVGISVADAKALKEKIDELNVPRLKPEHVIKLVDILPASEAEVKSVLQGYPLTITAESTKKIAELIKEYSIKNEKEMKRIEIEYAQKLKKEAEEKVREEAKAAKEAKKEEEAAEKKSKKESAKKSKDSEPLEAESNKEITEIGNDEDAE